MTIEGGLGESYDIDELWPDEAEVGAMLRTYYRRQPPPSVMAQHLAELEHEVGAIGLANPVPKAAVRFLAAACLLVAAVSVGLLVNGTGPARIDTVGDGRVEPTTTTTLTASTSALPSTTPTASTVPTTSTMPSTSTAPTTLAVPSNSAAPPTSNHPATTAPPSTPATHSTTVGPPSSTARAPAPTAVGPAAEAGAPPASEPGTTSTDPTTTTQAPTTSSPPTTAAAPAPTEPSTATTVPPTTAPEPECVETGWLLFRTDRCDDGQPPGLLTGLLDLIF